MINKASCQIALWIFIYNLFENGPTVHSSTQASQLGATLNKLKRCAPRIKQGSFTVYLRTVSSLLFICSRAAMASKAPRPGPYLDFWIQYALIRNNQLKKFGVEYWAALPGQNSLWLPCVVVQLFLPGWSETEIKCSVHVALSKQLTNKFKLKYF